MRALVTLASICLIGACAEPPGAAAPPYKVVNDTKHLMSLVVEPAADRIWDSSGFIMTLEGEENLAPTTEEGWLAVKQGAAMVAESGNLLMMPAHAQGREEWIRISAGLVEAGERAMAAADARDGDALFETGAALYGVCLSCHQVYWADGGRFTD